MLDSGSEGPRISSSRLRSTIHSLLAEHIIVEFHTKHDRIAVWSTV
jgi:hypothetical protein